MYLLHNPKFQVSWQFPEGQNKFRRVQVCFQSRLPIPVYPRPVSFFGVIFLGGKLQIAVGHQKITIQIAHPNFFPKFPIYFVATWLFDEQPQLLKCQISEPFQQVSLCLCQRKNTTKNPTSVPWSSWHVTTFLVKGAGTTVFGHRCSKLGWRLRRYATWECEMVVVITRESAM